MIRPARAGNGGKHLIEDGKVLRDRPFHRKLRRVEHPDGLRFRIARFRVASAHVLGRAGGVRLCGTCSTSTTHTSGAYCLELMAWLD
jgi:hypothetical protein